MEKPRDELTRAILHELRALLLDLPSYQILQVEFQDWPALEERVTQAELKFGENHKLSFKLTTPLEDKKDGRNLK